MMGQGLPRRGAAWGLVMSWGIEGVSQQDVEGLEFGQDGLHSLHGWPGSVCAAKSLPNQCLKGLPWDVKFRTGIDGFVVFSSPNAGSLGSINVISRPGPSACRMTHTKA